jgi:hypothetical protein
MRRGDVVLAIFPRFTALRTNLPLFGVRGQPEIKLRADID